MNNIKKIVIFVSGSGSNFKSIQKSIVNNEIRGCIKLLISDNSNSLALDYAKSQLIDSKIINRSFFNNYQEYSRYLLSILDGIYPDLIILSGYLKKIPRSIINKYKFKILNIHPSLLPKFGGKGFFGINVHKAVIKSKEKFSGATIHFVTENYDEGPIIYQQKTQIRKNEKPEDLAKRILEIEHQIYPYVIKCFCNNGIERVNGQPQIKGVR